MFVTIKYDPPIFFSVGEDPTIERVKIQVEKFLKIPREQQKITGLSKVINNCEKLEDVIKYKECNEGVLLLYNLDPQETSLDHIDANKGFVAILNVHRNEEEATKQFKYIKKCYDLNNERINTSPYKNNEDIVLESSQSYSSSDNDSPFDSGDSSTDSSNESEDDDRKKREDCKRKGRDDNQKQAKKSKHSLDHKEYYYQYLDELPECRSQGDNQRALDRTELLEESNKVEQDIPQDPNLMKEAIPSLKISDTRESSEQEQSLDSDSGNETVIIKELTFSKEPVQVPAEKLDKPIYSLISPDQKQHLIVVTNCTGKMTSESSKEFLVNFLPAFHQSPVKDLKFNEEYPVNLHEDKLWIACCDKKTCEWTLNYVTALFKDRYKASLFADFYNLKECSIVIPNITKSSDWSNILNLIEKQNESFVTAKWIVQGSKKLENPEDAISGICPNEVVDILIDDDSIEILEKCNYRLKYCFWTLKFSKKLKPSQKNDTF